MKNWNEQISQALQKQGYKDYESLNIFGYLISFKNYDDEMFEWQEQGKSPEEIADIKISLLEPEISRKYNFLTENIWNPTLSENFSKPDQIFSYSKLVTDASGYIRWIEYQERLANRTHNNSSNDYTVRRNSIIRKFLEDVVTISRRMLNGLQRFENRPEIYNEYALNVRAEIEARYVNPLLDYGTSDATDTPFVKQTGNASEMIVNPDIKLFHYGEIYKYFNSRAEQAKYNQQLVNERRGLKNQASYRYNMLPDFSADLNDILEHVTIERDDMLKITQRMLDSKKLYMYRNVFSKLMDSAYKYMDVLDIIIPLNFQVKDCLEEASLMLSAEQNMHYHPQRPVDPEIVGKYKAIVDFYLEIFDIIDSFKDGYSEWARHHMNEYGIKWAGKFLDVYGMKNPLNIEYDYSTYEICYFENKWDEFWGVYSYKMSEP